MRMVRQIPDRAQPTSRNTRSHLVDYQVFRPSNAASARANKVEAFSSLGHVQVLHPHYTEAVDVCFVIVQTGLDHFRSEIQRSSRHGTRDRFGLFRNTDIGYFDNIFLRQLWENQINSMEIDIFLIPKSKNFDC